MIYKNVEQKIKDYIHYHERMMLNDSRMMERLVECRDNSFSARTKKNLIRNTIFRSPLQSVQFRLNDILKDYDLR